MEVWKKIKGFENYQVSNYGNVRSNKFNKTLLLKQTKDSTRYLTVGLYKFGKCYNKTVHSLVAIAFLNHIPNKYNLVVDHINNNSLDNKLENLQIVTHRKNISKEKKGFTSKYIGVSWYKTKNKWVSTIHFNGKKKHLGYFDCEYDAHLAYENKLKELL
jgi:hypothetical protein